MATTPRQALLRRPNSAPASHRSPLPFLISLAIALGDRLALVLALLCGFLSAPFARAADIVVSEETTTQVALGDTDTLTVTGDPAGSITVATSIPAVTVGTGVGSIENNGTISGEVATTGFGIRLENSSTIANGINNTGEIRGYVAAVGVVKRGTSSASTITGGITNSGTMKATLPGTVTGVDGSVVSLSGVTLSGGISNSGLIEYLGSGTRAGGIWLDTGTTINGGIENSGTIKAVGNASILLGGSGSGTVNDGIRNLSGGLLDSGVVALRLLTGARVNGGVDNAGTLRAPNATFLGANDSIITGGVTNQVTGLIEATRDTGTAVQFGNTAQLDGTFTNAGTIRGGAASGTGIWLSSASNKIINGGIVNSGTIEAGGNALNLANSTNAFTVTNTGLIDGGAVLGINTLDLNGATARVTGATTGASATVNVNGTFASENTFNVGTFNVASGGTFVMNHNVTVGAGGFNNSGTLRVDTGTSVSLTGTLTSGGSAVINGSLTTSAINVASGGRLSGRGTLSGTIAGAGTVNPGNSPGILTAAAVDPSAGTDFVFEFSAAVPNYADAAASDNDVLRLTDPTTPFASALTSANTKTLFLNFTKEQLTVGSGSITTLEGGFFTDLATDFTSMLNNQPWTNAGFQVYVLGDGQGTDNSLNGQGYYNWRNPAMFNWNQSLFLSTVPRTANFGSGNVEGQVMLLTVAVPEPSTVPLAALGILGATAAGWRRRRRRIHSL